MADQFQVKYQGKLVGTATWADLQQQASRGQLTPLHKISPDGVQWRYASEIPELFGAPGGNGSPPQSPARPAPPARPVEWYRAVGDEKLGPFEQSVLLQQLAEGQAGFDDLVWCEGLGQWRPLRTVFPREVQAEERKRQKAEARRKKEEARKRRPVIPPEQQSYSMLAIASLVFSVLWVFGIGSAVGVILGFLGLYDIGTSKGYHKGLPFAIIGILLGLLGAALALVFFAT